MKRSLDATYRLHREEINRCARAHARRHRQDREEVEAEANLIFVRCCRTLDLDRGALLPRLRSLLSKRLIDRRRVEQSRKRLLNRLTVDLNRLHGRPDFDSAKFAATLPPDAGLCVRLASQANWNLGACGVRRELKLALRRLGWSRNRIRLAFREVRNALQGD